MKLSYAQIFYNFIKNLSPDNIIGKYADGYYTKLPIKKTGTSLVFDTKNQLLKYSKLNKVYVGGEYEDVCENITYKVEIKEDRAILYPL